MDINLYKKITTYIREFRGLSIDCLAKLTSDHPKISKDTLASILSYEYQSRMKAKYVKNSNTKKKYWEAYTTKLNNSECPGIILRIAEDADIAPCLVAKLILEVYFEDRNEDNGNFNVNTYLRNTALIPDQDLAYEVFLCTHFDNLYSPVADIIRSSIGQQYEIKLHNELVKLGLAFRDEEYLRRYGYDKTPDIKLEVPVAVDGFIINWIESKALFGTEGVHKEYITNQYLSYWNRFGPGLVIYWFGFVETIVDKNNKCFIICDQLPENIVQIGRSE
ncbi:hypothetical protein WA026_003079 [Henosepilachna vigintioctopunctata]|uniref:CDAN1-interacting nuclease 1 n=1 Tax=Henosepilachna vigintioctopunctata TaxID=420089 RepID=A0AAW1TLA5_9CUCU